MSVRKRSWKTTKGEAKEAWIVDYTDQAGDRHIETFERKKDADARHAEVTVDVKKGIHVAPSKSITVEKAAENWLNEASARGLERATVKTYAEHVKHHIVPLLGRTKLSEISVPVVTQFKKRPAREGRRNRHSSRRSRSAWARSLPTRRRTGLHLTMRCAICAAARKDAVERHTRKLKVGVDIPTKEQVSAIIRHAPTRYRALLAVAAFTGLRASELRGLRWEDVDLKKGELHVTQRADRYNDIGSPKSDDSARTVPFGSFVANTLREWKLRNPGELVFAPARAPWSSTPTW